jgi:uncharacterized protein YfeS
MEITTSIHTYNTYGGHSTISLVGDYFSLNSPSSGEAIKELEIHVYFEGGAPNKNLQSLFEQYNNFIQDLPNSKFYRKKGRFELNLLSSTGDASVVSGYGPPNLPLFVKIAKEVASYIDMLKLKVKKNDDFNLNAFLEFIQSKVNQLPQSEQEFSELQNVIEIQKKKEAESLSDWDKLVVDWSDFHPQARETLNTPFFWSNIDDFSPNGNDTGADVLSFYQTWKKRNKNGAGLSFLQKIMRDWGIEIPVTMDEPSDFEIYEEAVVGLAFAQIKVDGACSSDVKKVALEAIGNIIKRVTEQHQDWDLFEERISTLNEMAECLNEKA